MSIAITSIYLAALIFQHQHNPGTLVPDEISFVGNASSRHPWSLFTSMDLGYGGLFWLFLHGVVAIFSQGVVNAIFLMLLVSPLLLFLYLARGWATLFGVALWMGMPMAWWYGKVISPDSVLVFLAAMATLCALKCRPALCALILGISVGIKLNAVAIVPAIGLIGISNTRNKSLQMALLAVIAFGIGVVISAPILVANPSGAREVFSTYIFRGAHDAAGINSALFQNDWTWDLIHTSAIFSSRIAFIGYCGLLVIGLIRREADSFFLLVGLIFSVTLIQGSHYAFGWYWFPFLTLIYLIVAQQMAENGSDWPRLFFAALIVIGNAPFVIDDIKMRAAHNDRMGHINSYVSCLSPKINTIHNAGKEIFIRSFVTVENSLSDAFGRTIKPGGYPFDGNFRNLKQGSVSIIDTQVFLANFYQELKGVPPVCGGAFIIVQKR